MEAEISDAAILRIGRRIVKRRSHGVILMGSASPGTHQMIFKLKAAGIPVVTLATDIPQSDRIVDCGLDNFQAG